ncbi:MAG: ABC transporter [Rhodobacteraceae bacterium TMED111]|nr:ABC transporter [Marinovum sp.]OUV38451.1 MAG: ABC transporter [Rhodobacteraceae bacterium TMED111]|tara:strand:+ start:521 stop:1126 length:606 start_codon:yes stop_codon:yes gene_type:complete
MNKSFLNRRYFVISLATAVASVSGKSTWAATAKDAELLVGRVVREINAVISSGNSEAIMLKQFEKIFKSYADVKTIARYALGNDARALNKVQMDRFTEIYSVYVSHKYGRRFGEFIGGKIVVQKSRPIKSFFEVETLAHIKGWEPFTVSFLVSNKSGKLLFFNIFIEGINMLLSERTEIGAMLDKRRGNIKKVMKDLQNAS